MGSAARCSLIVIVLFACQIGFAQDTISGEVVHVVDGDTADVKRSDNGETVRVRFGGIDTPESNQRHGQKATDALTVLVLGKTVRAELTGKRSGSRMIGELYVPQAGGDDIDVSLELIKGGHAWWFWQFAEEDSARSAELAAAEVQAKIAKVGLFSAGDPIYPRVFRRGARIPNEVLLPEPDIIDNEVRIVVLLPDPNGIDAGNEEIRIGNGTSLNVSLEGWSVRDDDGGSFQLSGTLPPGETKTFIIANPDSLVLGNRGDKIELLDADGHPVQLLEYGEVGAGDLVTP